MKKIAVFLASSILLSSCTAQIKVDLQQLKLDENVTPTIQKLQVSDKMEDPHYGLKSYQIIDLNGISYGSTKLSKYELPGGDAADYNCIFLHVTNYPENKFLGLTINLSNKQEGDNLLNSLIKEFGTPEKRSTGGNGEAFFWDVKDAGKWVFYTKDSYKLSTGAIRSEVQCSIIKKGTRVSNSSKQDVFTILESFNLSHPKE